jgi:hypothetical protein
MTEADIAELQKRIAQLEELANPKPRKPSARVEFQPLDQLSMPRSAFNDLVRAVPDDLVRELVADGSRPVSLPGAKPGEDRTVPSERGWRDQVPLAPPSGVGSSKGGWRTGDE